VTTQADFPAGTAVVYTPYDGGPAEDGVVTKAAADPSLVFVRYAGQHPGADGQATPINRLRRLS
jgi:hypothetical protein